MAIKIKRRLSKLAALTGNDIHFWGLRQIWQEKLAKGTSDRILQSGIIDPPFTITIEPTMRCNLRCFMCFQSNYRKAQKEKLAQKELSANKWRKFLEESRPLIKTVGLTGGEIFVKNDIFEILDSCEQLKIPFSIVTNGVLINKEVAKKLINYRFLQALCFSIHGLNQTHDKIVGIKGAFTRTTKAIKLVVKEHFWVAANCVISETNLTELSQLVGFCASLGMDSIGFQLENFVTPKEERLSRQFLKDNSFSSIVQSKVRKTYPYSFSSLMRAWNLARQTGRKEGIPVTFTPSTFYTHPKLIYSGSAKQSGFKLLCEDLLNCRIDPEGNATACQFLPQSFGNVKDQPLEKIWFSSRFKIYRQTLLKGNLMQICNRCCKIRVLSK